MNGNERREDMINCIKTSEEPVSGSFLAKKYGVSRQVVVQDIALLRARGYDIISTNKGYVVNKSGEVTKVFKVSHTDEQTQEELNTIVDLGGKVIDVFVNHKTYGRICAPLNISSRRNAAQLIENIKAGKSTLLKNITSNFHYHTVSADSGETMDLIEKALIDKNFLIKPIK